MKNFRENDFVYYDLKARPITKRPKASRKATKKTSVSELLACKQRRINVDEHCLQEVYLPNQRVKGQNYEKKTEKTANFEMSLMEMQKAATEQEKMYQKYCFGTFKEYSYCYEAMAQESSSLSMELADGKASFAMEYFSELLEDPKDKENILFTEITSSNLEKEDEKSENMADYDVSAYFTV